jgi:IS30 family transposase
MATKKHLTLSQRIIIENGLREGKKIKRIAREAGVSRSTVVREVKAYRHDKLEWSCRFGGQNWCVKRTTCGVFGVCRGGKGCSGKCGQCRLCNRYCEEFVPERCREHYDRAPYVCDGCAYVEHCARMHTYYSAERADKLAREAWGEAHAGAIVTRDELLRYDKLIKDGLSKGQSLFAIYLANRALFNCDVRTLYNYLNEGRFDLSKRGDQPRACMIRPRRRKAKEHKVDRDCLKGRLFEEFVGLLESDPDAIGRVSEMDTLEGRKGGKVIVTFFNVQTMMMFGVLLGHKDARSVNDALVKIHAAFLDVQFPLVFGILLGDRGTEFSDPLTLETLGCRVFYCDAGKPGQKGGIERNHHEMRRVLVKGVSFDNLTQADVNLVLSHVNSYHRLELGGMSAFEMMRFCYGEEFVESAREFGLVEIPANEVNLTPALLPDIAEQVVERARRVVEEEEAASGAVEALRRKRGGR